MITRESGRLLFLGFALVFLPLFLNPPTFPMFSLVLSLLKITKREDSFELPLPLS